MEYFDDRFLQGVDSDSETELEETVSETDIETNSDTKTKKVKVVDKSRNFVYRKVNKRKRKVYFYETKNTPKSLIRNAVSGHYQMNCLVGTKDEDHFFKVRLCTGETGPDPPLLFFHDPGQYERLFFTTLPQSTKEKWLKRYTPYINM